MIQKTGFIRNKSRFFYNSPKYHIKILLGVFNADNEDTSNPTFGGESLYQGSKLCHIKKSSC
jgi:hypothetical protein